MNTVQEKWTTFENVAILQSWQEECEHFAQQVIADEA